jgi:hypothetical protein
MAIITGQVDSHWIGDDASELLPCHTAPPT